MKKRIVIDCEVYPNYFLLSALNIDTGKVNSMEMDEDTPLDTRRVRALMQSCTTISFNGENFDLPIIALALSGASCERIKKLSDAIIKSRLPAWRIARECGVNVPRSWDHIDLFEVVPGKSSLKIYGGRLHHESIEDLPIDPDTRLSDAQKAQVLSYCANDLSTTLALYRALEGAVKLRENMSKQYGMDLRSKSDAQIAETVILSELEKVTGTWYRKPDVLPDRFRYSDPKIIKFRTRELVAMFERVLDTDFEVGGNGAVVMPQWLREPIEVDGRKYQMGIGGLHSVEKAQYIHADVEHILLDMDVAAYYPSIILQQGIAPESIGAPFLKVYRSLVERRLKAKREGDKVADATLKIAINGSFGKLGSKYSAFYAPELLIQTTVTGQLALLMLIERLALEGIDVVSANTDGIVIHAPRKLESVMREVAFDWMLDTGYLLEETHYHCIASRNVNNYVAVTTSGSLKGKGCFARGGLSKNPDFQIIFDAVARHVANGADVEETIRECDDIRKFVCVRRVQGGAVWRGEELGRSVRFYQSSEVSQDESITYKTNSNRVPKSAGARPAMRLPDTLPDDIDYDYYIAAARELLTEVGITDEGLFA